jgi:transcriptional regulator with XRE-family HTH domain
MIGFTIRRERLAQGLTLEALAARSGIAGPNLSRLERGGVDPRLSTVLRVLRALGLGLDVVPVERVTLRDVEQRMEEGAARLRAAGVTDRGAEARLDWKEARGLDTAVERQLLQ